MNKQELIKKYKKLEGVWDAPGAETARQIFLQDLEQLDEPEKVTVSEEEAKFIKTFDFNCESDVTKALYHVSRTGWGYYLTDNNGIELKDLSEGLRELENRKRLIKAILDGYKVEEEKEYLVKIKANNQYIMNNPDENAIFFYSSKAYASLTRKELEEAGFGWVFDCPGIEIEEVEKELNNDQ